MQTQTTFSQKYPSHCPQRLAGMSTLKLLVVVATTLIIAAGALVGVYAVADTIAVSVANSLNAEPKQSRLDTLNSAVARSTAAYQQARAQCRILPDIERGECFAKAKKERLRASNDANLAYNCSMRNVSPNDPSKNNGIGTATNGNPMPAIAEAPRNLANIDPTLYRIHRQTPL